MPSRLEGILNCRNGVKPTLGLALSGGGARGFAHIGVLKALEAFGLKPDIVAGVSAGSIAASLYCAGLSPDEIYRNFEEHGHFNDFTDWAIPKEGFFKLNKFADILRDWLPVETIEECQTPLVVCATNIEKGEPVAWEEGELVSRVVASCSIPIIFHPVRIDGQRYSDGGVLRNLPAWAIRDKADFLIGSICSPLDREYTYKPSLVDIAMRSYALMSGSNNEADIPLCDLIIEPTVLSRFGTFQISQMKRIMNEGYETACRTLEEFTKPIN